jgi:hypothetical protein
MSGCHTDASLDDRGDLRHNFKYGCDAVTSPEDFARLRHYYLRVNTQAQNRLTGSLGCSRCVDMAEKVDIAGAGGAERGRLGSRRSAGLHCLQIGKGTGGEGLHFG